MLNVEYEISSDFYSLLFSFIEMILSIITFLNGADIMMISVAAVVGYYMVGTKHDETC